MPTMSGGDAVVQGLLAHGVTSLYCLPGVQSDHLFNAIFDAGGALTPIHTRHEQGAAYMALGAAMATGRPAAYSVVPGPGFLNSCAALCTAWAVNAKVLALVGQIPSPAIGQLWGMLHEIPDQMAVLAQLTKRAERILTPAEAPGAVARAFQALNSGRPRPVGLELPADVLQARGDVRPQARLDADAPPRAGAADIARAADLIAQAQRPMIFVASGAIHAADEVRSLAEKIGAPVVGHRLGRGVLDARHPLSLTASCAHALWAQTDCAILVGARAQPMLQGWGFDAGIKLVQIDVDPAEIGRFQTPDVALLADAEEALAAINDALSGRSFDTRARVEACAEAKARFLARIAVLEPQLSYLKAIRDVLPDDGVLVDDLTQVGYVARIAYPAHRPRTLINSGFQGTLGWGVATGLGAKHALGDPPVIVISGDGGFMYNVQELSTAVRHRIGAVFVVFNDGAFGNVRRMQQELHGNRVIASDLLNPDFMKLAESFGLRGRLARNPDALRGALEAALAEGGPQLIEVPIGETPSPWPFINLPKVR
ncbi:MAG TPA: thiamine pyrophosphate-dependent enzyme [Beijerinckiaceae bacterium]